VDALLDTLFSRLAHASVQAVLLAGVIYAVCRCVPSLSASARTTLWWLLGAQLIAGVACPTLLGLPLLPATTPVTSTAALDVGPMTLPGSTADMPADTGGTFPWLAVLIAIWWLAVLAQAAVAAWRWRKLAGVVGRSMAHDDVRVETLCARRARELGLRRSPRLAVSTEVDSPQVIGLWRPTILLPLEERLGDEDLDLALMHELAHVRRGDLVLGCIPALARTLFFFHPLVHLAVREYALCREAACDALVVSRGDTVAKTYGRLLLRLGVAPRPHHALPGASPTFQTLKRRLLMLGQANDTHPRVLTWCLVATIAAVGVFPWRVVAANHATTSTSHTYTSQVPAPPAAPAPPPGPASMQVPAAPPAPPAPVAPVAPAAPALPMTETTNIHGASDIHGHPTNGFVFVSDDIHVASGTRSDIERAEALRRDGESFAWYRDGKQAWVLRDPAYLKRIHAAYAQASRPADTGAMSADKEAALDRQQAVLDEQMSRLTERQTELAMKESDPRGPRDSAAYAAGHAAIGKEQAAVAQKMAELGQRRALQGKTMAEWGRKQAEASRKALEDVNAILAEAIRNHAAQAAR
jgi:beta-lactamase regulating signal transducer with metallopeptidase domain